MFQVQVPIGQGPLSSNPCLLLGCLPSFMCLSASKSAALEAGSQRKLKLFLQQTSSLYLFSSLLALLLSFSITPESKQGENMLSTFKELRTQQSKQKIKLQVRAEQKSRTTVKLSCSQSKASSALSGCFKSFSSSVCNRLACSRDVN